MGSSATQPITDDLITPPTVHNTSQSSSSHSRILPVLPTQITATSTVRGTVYTDVLRCFKFIHLVVRPTSTQQESIQHPADDDVTLIVVISVTSLIAIMMSILFVLIIIACRVKRRYPDFVIKRKTF